jgi:hemerythrin superfamily protein
MPRSSGSSRKSPSTRQLKQAAGIKDAKSAIVLLKADHREVEGLFKAFAKAKDSRDKQSLAKQICDSLTLHMRIEEEIFYPAFRQVSDDDELHNEAVVEHQGAKTLIKEIESGASGDPLFDARVSVLSEMIKHHVKEEEAFLSGMFAKARAAGMDLYAVGALLEARKRELAAGAPKRTPKTPPKTRSAFMGAAAVARSKRQRPPVRHA